MFMHYWNKGEALKFLEYHCINKNVQDHIYEQAEKCRMLRVALEEGSHFTEEKNMVIRQDTRKNPDMYKRWNSLPYWKQEVNLEKYPEVPMHLLFLNVAKSVMVLWWWTGRPFDSKSRVYTGCCQIQLKLPFSGTWAG
jgi:hypothetical protein